MAQSHGKTVKLERSDINVKPERGRGGGGGGGGADVGHLIFCDIFIEISHPRDENFGKNRSNIPTQNFCSSFL